MEKEIYLLKLSKELDINLFDYPNITLKGNKKDKIVKTIIKKNDSEFCSIVLDKDGLLDTAVGTEYVRGERKAVARLKEISEKEIDRRMEKLTEGQSRNFFDYNLNHTGEDEIKPTLLFFLSRNIGRTTEKYLRRLTVFAKATGIFVFFCENEDDKIHTTLITSSFLDIVANDDEAYIREHLVDKYTRNFKNVENYVST